MLGKSHALEFQMEDEAKRRRLDEARGTPLVDEPEAASEPVSEDVAVEELEDGSAVVKFEEDKPAAKDSEFRDNIAELFDNKQPLITGLVESVERDKESRSQRDKQYADGIKRTGLGEEAPGGADFNGASRAVHPALVEGCIDFSARAMKELFRGNAPVKTSIIGEATREKLQKAERKKTYMNWQLTHQIKEYRPELEQCLTQVPLGGSQYMKVWYDERFERPRVEFRPIDDIFLPFSASSFLTAPRVTDRQKLTRQEMKSRVGSGLYRDVVRGDGSLMPEPTAAEAATGKVEGKEDNSYNEDGLREVYEIYTELEVEGDTFSGGKPAPYIITVDKDTARVLACYRNWEEDDEKRESLAWMVEFGFIPWRGAYKIGLAHIVGSLSGASTGALRALLDASLQQNSMSALKLKGARMAGQNVVADPTQISEIEGPAGIDDIRKLAMPFPFPGPSQTLFALLEWCTAQMKGAINTAEEKIADAGANTPVGTTLAVIEQGSITYSSIHSRLHESQARMLEIIHRINGTFLDDEVTVEELGDLVVRREDFLGPMDVVPVSDPNIFSETQRYAQIQEGFKLATAFPQFYKLDKLNQRALMMLNFPEADEILQVPEDPEERTPGEENAVASKPNSALKAYDDQDHLAHLKVHLSFMVSPIFALNPVMAMPALPKLMEHCKEHLIALYRMHMNAAVEAAGLSGLGRDPEQAAAEAVVLADQELAKDLSELMPLLEKAQQEMQKFMPQPPADPKIEVERMRQKAAADKDAKDAQTEQARQQLEERITNLQEQSENMRHQQEMQVAARNADLAAGQAAQAAQNAQMLQQMKDAATAAEAAAARQHEQLMSQLETQAQAALEAQRARHQEELELLRSELKERTDALTTVLGALVQPDKTATGEKKPAGLKEMLNKFLGR